MDRPSAPTPPPRGRPASLQVGILDVDLCGPSIPRMLRAQGRAVHQCDSGWVPVFVDQEQSISLMSVGFLLESPDEAVVWRGPKKNGNDGWGTARSALSRLPAAAAVLNKKSIRKSRGSCGPSSPGFLGKAGDPNSQLFPNSPAAHLSGQARVGVESRRNPIHVPEREGFCSDLRPPGMGVGCRAWALGPPHPQAPPSPVIGGGRGRRQAQRRGCVWDVLTRPDAAGHWLSCCRSWR